MSCNIIVEMTNDVVPEIDRVHELLMRSNQLNYTKWRQDKEGLLQLVSDDSVKSGYVSVRDNFGDYGIVGFYAVKDGRLLHYFFSCRTVGMMVEQYVYMQLNCPELKVVGEVRSELNNTFLPPWINREDSCKNSSDLFNKGNETLTNTGTVLLKGPCDLGSIFQYFKSQEDIDTEFSFSNDQGVFVEGFNHIAATASAVSSDGQMREKTFDGIWWLDEGNLITRFGDTKYDVAVFSMLPTSNIGLYRSRLTGAYVGLCEKSYDLTNRKYWKAYMDGEVFSSGIPFTLEDLEHFSNVFEFVEYDYETMLAGDLQSLYDNKGRAELILMLGSELPCEKDHRFNYTNRHSEHARVNRIVEAWASDKKDVYCLHIGDHVKSEDDYTNAINHFQKKIYYSLARELVEVINGCDSVADFAVARPSDRARRKIKRIPAKVKRIFAGGK